MRSTAELLGSVSHMHSSPSGGQPSRCPWEHGAEQFNVKEEKLVASTPQASQAAAKQAREERC